MQDAKAANKLIQLKIIMKLNRKTMKYYKKIIKLSNVQNVRIMIIEYIFVKINNAAYIVRKNIILQNMFIRKIYQNEDAIFAKNFIKHSIINVLKDKRKKEKLKT